jgi:hypothetical protein
VAAIALAGCASGPDGTSEALVSPWASRPVHTADVGAWEHYLLPGKTPTRFQYAMKDGREAMAVTARSSASMLRRRVHIPADELGSVRFSWKVPQLLAEADMALREADDSPVRIILAFEGDRSKFSARDAMLSELTRSLTGEEMPYATLMYVWCNSRAPGSVIHNPRTSRVRKLVVESGATNLDRWLDYERDVRADFMRAFGEAPGPLVGIAIMSDSDNTKSLARAWYGPVRFPSK